MEEQKKQKNEQREKIFMVIKGLALFFCTYPLFELFFRYSSMDSFSEINLQSMAFSLVLIILVLCIWLVLNSNKKASKWHKFIEIMTFYCICLMSIAASGWYTSSYKFLLVFMVVAYTIQISMKSGILISALSSTTLILIDLLMYREPGVNNYLQSDLALSMLFFTLAYLLGRYAQMEKEHIEELTRLANVDGLTGLYNHRYFYDSLDRMFRECEEKGTALSLLMLDIDYFKHYNDIFGHQKGDIVLQDLSALLRETIGGEGVVCRYGGEEFSVLLPGKNVQEAQQVAEELRLKVLAMDVEGENLLENGHLSISLGVAERYPEGDDLNNFVSRADSALYRAKYLRKNRVEVYADMLGGLVNLNVPEKNAVISAKVLINLVNVRDSYTYMHTERVVYCCSILAKKLPLNEADTRTLLLSAYLHDLGKVDVPKEVLITERRLTAEEWEVVRKHPLTSYAIVNNIEGLSDVAEIVRMHHERVDGKGYPFGLTGDQLPPLAKLLSLADSFDAMTNNRPYKKGKTFDGAFEEIRACEGTQFDAEYAEAFIRIMQEETKEK